MIKPSFAIALADLRDSGNWGEEAGWEAWTIEGHCVGVSRALARLQMCNEMVSVLTEEPLLPCWAHKPGSELNSRQKHSSAPRSFKDRADSHSCPLTQLTAKRHRADMWPDSQTRPVTSCHCQAAPWSDHAARLVREQFNLKGELHHWDQGNRVVPRTGTLHSVLEKTKLEKKRHYSQSLLTGTLRRNIGHPIIRAAGEPRRMDVEHVAVWFNSFLWG